MSETEIQISNLTAIIEAGNASADTYYQRGRLYWKLQQHGAAISDYETAAQLDSESPAAEALAMSRQIMDFYHKDRFNP
ncbi:MAG: tetratricopeptide repeat protein [Muribaculaceae bacterium]|nr:tetratricopeptide repeat protein [Muribaculaceae bacterium]MDE6332181.1 tetratricopeptide repeat protein [Muribaculaceae bacterium]